MQRPCKTASALLTLAACLWAGNASAATIPFFSTYPKIDLTKWYVSNGWTNGNIQSCEWRWSAVSVNQKNIKLTVSDKGGAIRPIGCAEMKTQKRQGYGIYEARLRSAAGSGLNTAFFTYVGPPVGVPQHDEIDFEFLGKNPRTVQLNYWVNGKSKDGTIINLGFDASAGFHDYRFIWEPTRIRWYVDGKLVHQTKAGAVMPSHAGNLFMSLWSGSAYVNNWLGPFTYKSPVSAEFAWVKYTPLN